MCNIYPGRQSLEGSCDGINHHDDREVYEPLLDLVWKHLDAVEQEMNEATTLTALTKYMNETFVKPCVAGGDQP